MGKLWASAISGALAARALVPRALKRFRERGGHDGSKNAATTTTTAAKASGADAPQSVRLLCDSTARTLDPEQFLERLAKTCPQELDLTEPSHGDGAMEAADALIRLEPALVRLKALRATLAHDKAKWPFFMHLAVILAVSKQQAMALDGPLHFSVVFAVYGEVNRLKTKAEHPNGEDFLIAKAAQLDWLLRGHPAATWSMTVSDDGCPDDSGGLCRAQAERRRDGMGPGATGATAAARGTIDVVYLKDGIAVGDPSCVGMQSPGDSRKGGAVHYGLARAARRTLPPGTGHCVAYTDADLSTHLGQSGLLLDLVLGKPGMDCAVGTRRSKDSVIVKSGSRNLRGVLHAYLWKQMMPEIAFVADTQTAFKAFNAAVIAELTNKALVERKFAFDIELMLLSHLRRQGSVGQCGIAWIDSEAESQSGDAEGYVALLRAIATIYRRYLPADPWREGIAEFVESLTPERFRALLENCPEGIAGRDAADFETWSGVSAQDLHAAAETETK